MEASNLTQNSQPKDIKEVPRNSGPTVNDENNLTKHFKGLSVNDTPAQGAMKEITDTLGKLSIDQKPKGEQSNAGESKQTGEPQEESKIEKKESNQPMTQPFEEVKLAENQFIIGDDSPMSKNLQTKRGVTLFGDPVQRKELEESDLNGKNMLVIIISAIPDLTEFQIRWDYLKSTVNKYTTTIQPNLSSEKSNFKVLVVCPEGSRGKYQKELKGYLCSIVGYRIRECEAQERPRNVGDARNAALLFGLLLNVNHFILSDDDRDSVYKGNKNNQINKNMKNLQEFQEKVQERICNRALLGIASQTNTRARKTPGHLIPDGDVRVAQLIVINLEILKKYNISYLPVRMGEDNTFCYDVSKLSETDHRIKVDEMWDWVHTSYNNLISIARTEDNTLIKNYRPAEYPYLREMFEKILRKQNKNYWISWKVNKEKKVKEDGFWSSLITLRNGYFSLSPDTLKTVRKE